MNSLAVTLITGQVPGTSIELNFETLITGLLLAVFIAVIRLKFKALRTDAL